MVIKRANQLKVMVSDEERVMLDTIADHDGLSASDAVRQLIRQRFLVVAAPSRHGARGAAELFATASKDPRAVKRAPPNRKK